MTNVKYLQKQTRKSEGEISIKLGLAQAGSVQQRLPIKDASKQLARVDHPSDAAIGKLATARIDQQSGTLAVVN